MRISNIFSRKRLRNAYLKVIRQSGAPESIARGAAIGLFVGFLFPIGFQTPIAFLLAVIFKARKVPALLFTVVTNPYTVTFIYPVQCYIGSKLLGSNLTLRKINFLFKTFFQEMNFANFIELGEEIMFPFFAGGALMAVISAVAGYYAVYGLVIRYRKRQQAKLIRKLARAATFSPEKAHKTE